MMKAKSFLLGLIAGGAAASISALLTAPASGKETRTVIHTNKNIVKHQLDHVKEQLLDIKRATTTVTKEGKVAFAAMSKDLKGSVNDWKNEIRPHEQNLKREIQEIETAIQELETTLNQGKNSN
ncbi:YtxH domain-containing protein [Cytobacillus gottheilii]|uniref:YtxH domain-containing protein n=1 Tax=Cytobacillus gottheilii TaxID=859144 RepID=UPI002148C502|nr:YtxH domain-containing protein [Cytobacillus gottheilii]